MSLRGFRLCLRCGANVLLAKNTVSADVTYQLTPAVHKPLPSALHLTSFFLDINPTPLPPPCTLPTSFLPSSHRYFIAWLHPHNPTSCTYTFTKKLYPKWKGKSNKWMNEWMLRKATNYIYMSSALAFFQAWEDLLKFDTTAGYIYHWSIFS